MPTVKNSPNSAMGGRSDSASQAGLPWDRSARGALVRLPSPRRHATDGCPRSATHAARAALGRLMGIEAPQPANLYCPDVRLSSAQVWKKILVATRPATSRFGLPTVDTTSEPKFSVHRGKCDQSRQAGVKPWRSSTRSTSARRGTPSALPRGAPHPRAPPPRQEIASSEITHRRVGRSIKWNSTPSELWCPYRRLPASRPLH
jgi:hypothetical protein